ncbi:MAG: hypothetical protein IJT59_05835 [Desulfovibrionaceae bacterium]|nr:hypothetical protein [Desulfovibrionaceae bacterium]
MSRFLPLFLAIFLFWPISGLAQGLANNQIPPTTPQGGPNLNYHWIEGGGARLHYRAVTYPHQTRLMGTNFQDPAAVPYLVDQPCNPCDQKRTYKRKVYKKKKVTKRKKAPKKLVAKKTPVPSTPKLGPVKPAAKPEPVKPVPAPPMKAVDPVGQVPPEPLQ